MNKVILIGNLTRDPETTVTGSGISVCKFSIAVNRNFTNASGERETDFFNIVAWRGLADNCGRYLQKGSKAAVSGRIETRTYEVEGQKRYATDIIAEEVEFLTRANEGGETASGGGKQAQKQQNKQMELTPVDDDLLPF